jgi:hypothetical protein
MLRKCVTCEEFKSSDDFYIDLRRRSGFFAECKKCNNARSKKWFEGNYENRKTEYLERVYRNRKSNPRGMLVRAARARAKKRGIECSITAHDIKWHDVCPVLGIPLTYGGNGKKTPDYNAASLDRVNNSLGYVPGNVVVISHRANALKRDASLHELEALVKWLRSIEDDA